jgi:hypothetical protein
VTAGGTAHALAVRARHDRHRLREERLGDEPPADQRAEEHREVPQRLLRDPLDDLAEQDRVRVRVLGAAAGLEREVELQRGRDEPATGITTRGLRNTWLRAGSNSM